MTLSSPGLAGEGLALPADPVLQHRLLAAAFASDFRMFANLMLEQQFGIADPLSIRHVQAIAWYLERVARGEITRLIITLPPRALKSTLASVLFPAYMLGQDPRHQILCVSYGQELSAEFQAPFAQLMRSAAYARMFPHVRLRRDIADRVETTRGGRRQAISTGGALTGRGADLIIIDDPMKADDALSHDKRRAVLGWFRQTLLSRLNDKRTGGIVLVMQRLHMDDLAGHLIREGGWTVLNLPAMAETAADIPTGPLPDQLFHREPGDLLQPDREPRTVLDRLKHQMGPFAFSAQYQQRPIPEQGAILNWDWFGRTSPHTIQNRGRPLISCDPATSTDADADYSAIVIARQFGRELHIIDIIRQRLSFPDLEDRMKNLCRTHRCMMPIIEDASIGTTLIQSLRRDGTIAPHAFKPKDGKVLRAHAVSSFIRNGQVLLPENHPLLHDLQQEVTAFPNGRHDDMVDAIVQLVDWAFNQPKNYSGEDF
jgi:predicted phage terminase large subunit-like protein